MKADCRSTAAVTWRADIDALAFWIGANSASCVVHRQAFRTLLRRDPTPQDCLTYFKKIEGVFRAAAAAKIAQNQIPARTNLHLTSRDVARKLVELSSAQRGDDQ
jgi:hypothetical protein